MGTPLTLANIARTGDTGAEATVAGAKLFNEATKGFVDAAQTYKTEVDTTNQKNSTNELNAFSSYLNSYTDQAALKNDVPTLEAQLDAATNLSTEDRIKAKDLIKGQPAAIEGRLAAEQTRQQSERDRQDKPFLDQLNNDISAAVASGDAATLRNIKKKVEGSGVHNESAAYKAVQAASQQMRDDKVRQWKEKGEDLEATTKSIVQNAKIPRIIIGKSSIEDYDAAIKAVNDTESKIDITQLDGLNLLEKAGVTPEGLFNAAVANFNIKTKGTKDGTRDNLQKYIAAEYGDIISDTQMKTMIDNTNSATGAAEQQIKAQKEADRLQKIQDTRDQTVWENNEKERTDPQIVNKSIAAIDNILRTDDFELFGTSAREDAIVEAAYATSRGMPLTDFITALAENGSTSAISGNFEKDKLRTVIDTYLSVRNMRTELSMLQRNKSPDGVKAANAMSNSIDKAIDNAVKKSNVDRSFYSPEKKFSPLDTAQKARPSTTTSSGSGNSYQSPGQ
jgi:hypothetical protein